MSEDDDWFERAMEDADDPGSEPADDSADDSGDEIADDSGDDAAEEHGSGTADDSGDDAAEEHGSGTASDGEAVPEEAGGDAAPDGEADSGGATGHGPDGAETGDDDLFEEDFATAFGGDGTTPSNGGPTAGGTEPTPAEADQAGGRDDEVAEEPFDPGSAFEGGEDFGFGVGPDSEFDDEEFESELDRLQLGIDGLDDMIRGGVPERSLMTVIGSAGTGKTTFGMQFLEHGLRAGETAIYITLEEDRNRIIDSAAEKGWPFDDYVLNDRLAVVDMDPVEMASSLTSIRDELPGLVERFGADRLVLDSVSLLELMYEDRAKRRNEVYDFAKSLKEIGVTTLLVSEASEDSPYTSSHGIVEYLTDAVFVLQFVRPSDFEQTRLAIEIQKVRDAAHSREMKPYEITDDGLEVYQQANIF